jgi:hypothetical protein
MLPEEKDFVPFDKITHPKKRAVLLGISKHTNRTKACEDANCSRESHYHWLRTDPDYAEAYADAKRMGADGLEDKATQRAFDGSDVLLIVRLKAEMPEKYRERFEGQLSGKNGSKLFDFEQVRAFMEQDDELLSDTPGDVSAKTSRP